MTLNCGGEKAPPQYYGVPEGMSSAFLFRQNLCSHTTVCHNKSTLKGCFFYGAPEGMCWLFPTGKSTAPALLI